MRFSGKCKIKILISINRAAGCCTVVTAARPAQKKLQDPRSKEQHYGLCEGLFHDYKVPIWSERWSQIIRVRKLIEKRTLAIGGNCITLIVGTVQSTNHAAACREQERLATLVVYKKQYRSCFSKGRSLKNIVVYKKWICTYKRGQSRRQMYWKEGTLMTQTSSQLERYPSYGVPAQCTIMKQPQEARQRTFLYSEALYDGKKLDDTLIHPNQVCSYGLLFWGNPFDPAHPLSSEANNTLHIPLRTAGCKLLVTTQVPTSVVLETSEHHSDDECLTGRGTPATSLCY